MGNRGSKSDRTADLKYNKLLYSKSVFFQYCKRATSRR